MSAAATKVIRTGFLYAAIILVGAIFSSIGRGIDQRNLTDWIITISMVALIALAGGFAIASMLWLCDEYLPRLAGANDRLRVWFSTLGWLIVAAALFLLFSTMAHSGR